MNPPPDEEFDIAFCRALNDDTIHCDALNELAWSVLDYSLDQRD